LPEKLFITVQCAINDDGGCAMESFKTVRSVVSSVLLMTVLTSGHVKCCCPAVTISIQLSQSRPTFLCSVWDLKSTTGKIAMNWACLKSCFSGIDYRNIRPVIFHSI
jgi:hypothetical protein